jgi:putative endopeptidase
MKYLLLSTNLFFALLVYSQPENMDLSVRPQDDFYNYVNGTWMKKTEIPGDRGRWGSFDQLREHTDTFTLGLLNRLVKRNYPNETDEQKIKSLYQAFLNWNTRNAAGINPLRPYFYEIDKIKNKTDFYNYVTVLAKEGQDPFVGTWVYSHMKRSNEQAAYLGDANLALGRDYFQKDDESSKVLLKALELYIDKLYDIIYPEKKSVFGRQYVKFQKEMAKTLLTVEDIRNSELQYNPVSVKDYNSNISSFPIGHYFSYLNMKVDTVIISEIGYHKALDKFIREDNISFLKHYLKVELLRNSMSSLSKTTDSIQFDFYGKQVSGQNEQRSMEKRGLESVNSLLGESLGKVYAQEAFSPQAKSTAVELVSYLKKSFEKHIKDLQWMSDSTKQKALYKLSTIVVKIGYPDKWKDYSKLNFNSTLYFDLAKNHRIWSVKENREKLGKPVDKTEWGMNPQTVNAYYNSSYNEIVFPAAILQHPFYSVEANPATNFGGIGAVIGHEISHGFDDGGSQYDGDGNLRNWWTDEDKAKFQKATKALEAQFNGYEPLPKMFVNGKFTLGENIADLAGASVAFDALRIYMKDHPQEKGKETYSEKDFFLSWATIWRSKMRDKALANMIKTDPHSPGKYRAIGPLVNLDAFYEIFQVKEGDKLYKKPEERIVIW